VKRHIRVLDRFVGASLKGSSSFPVPARSVSVVYVKKEGGSPWIIRVAPLVYLLVYRSLVGFREIRGGLFILSFFSMCVGVYILIRDGRATSSRGG
jgi:hypothetical protein